MTGPTKVKDSTAQLTSANSNWVNVLSIAGMANDGVTDCYGTLNAYLSGAAAGTVLYFPAGTYLFASGTITPAAANIKFEGASNVATIFKNTSYATYAGPILDSSTAVGFACNNIGFNYTGAVAAPGLGSSTCMAVKLRAASKLRFTNNRVTCTLRVSTAVGIQSWFSPKSGGAALSDYILTGNTITANDVPLDVNQIVSAGVIKDNQCYITGSGPNFAMQFALCNGLKINDNIAQSGVVLSGSTNCKVTENDFIVSVAPASAINGAVHLTREAGTTASTGNTLIGNTVNAGSSGNYTAAVYVDTNCTGNIIAQNQITSASHVMDGISLSASSNTVYGNIISGNCLRGINTLAGSYNTYTANYISGTQNAGIKHNITTPVTITGNVIVDANQANSASANGAAIDLTSATDHVTVSGNVMKYTVAIGIKPAYGVFGSSLTNKSNVAGNNVVDSQTGNYGLAAAIVSGANN
jgi:hypothetical protein